MESSSVKKKKKVLDAKKKMQNMNKEQLRAAIEKKKECNARAMTIVERLIEPRVDEMWMLENLFHINQSHFQDAVEERSITKCCGYPLCDSVLGEIPTKQYHISTKQNKVFDITDRKNYCSNICYKAGVFLKDQLYTSPLWLRDCEEVVEYKLYSSDSGVTGLEVDLGITNPIEPENEPEVSKSVKNEKNERNLINSAPVGVNDESDSENEDFQDAQEEMDEVSEKFKDVAIGNVQRGAAETFFMSETMNETSGCSREKADYHEQINCDLEGKSEVPDPKKTDKRKSVSRGHLNPKKLKTQVPFGMKIESAISEWFTVESLVFVCGEDAVKEKFQKFGSPLNETQFNKIRDTYMYERYEEICRRLNILEIRDREEKLQPSKPLPDYEVLKQEAKELELKVKSFFKGDAQVSFKIEKDEENDDKYDEDDPQPVLPLVERHAIRATRRRIVLDKLNKTLPDILSALNLSQFSVRKEIQDLVYTMSFSATNIIMKPSEWNLIAIILIRIMSIRNQLLLQAYQSDLTQKRLVNLLMTYNLDLNFLERQVLNVNDIEQIIRNSQ